MPLSKRVLMTLLGAFTLIILIGLSYLNKSIFMEQILICAFIIGLTGLVHILGDLKKMEQDDKRAKGNS